MLERGWGRVVNILDVYAKMPFVQTMPTSVSRAAGMALTKSLASEYIANKALVNALLVGLIEADQILRLHETDVREGGKAGGAFALCDADGNWREYTHFEQDLFGACKPYNVAQRALQKADVMQVRKGR